MKITVVSDSHKAFQKLKDIISANLDSDMLIHLGDGEFEFNDVAELYPGKTFIFVNGNCDYGQYPSMRIVTAESCRILCVHGHMQNVHDGLGELLSLAAENNCQLALFGHTHMYRTGMENGIYFMNPGSISDPRGKKEPSYGIIMIDSDNNINMNIISC